MAKRMMDIAGALAALVVLSPLLAALALAVRVRLGRPVIHRSVRPGKDERLFTMVKFRTMTMETDRSGALLPDEQRMPPFGAWLRRSSLDELPELWNVLKGDMSFVGPRPLLTQYLPLYSAAQRQRHNVRPGITGWAQVNGRNAISWDQKFAHDIWYVHNRSVWLDLRILLRTVGAIAGQRGISAADHATMPLFRGSSDATHNAGSASSGGSQ